MTNQSLLSRIIVTIFLPLKRYPVFFGSLWFLSSFASILSNVLAIERWPYKLLCINFLVAYLLTFVRYRLRYSRFEHLFTGGVYSFFYLCAIVETFLVYFYQTLISPATIQLLLQTDSQECAEFCRSTFLNINFVWFILASIAIARLHFSCIRRFERDNVSTPPDRMTPRILWGGEFLAILLLTSSAVSVETHLHTRRIWTLRTHTELLTCQGEYGGQFSKRASMVGRLTYSLFVQRLTANDKNDLHKVQRKIPIESCDFLSPHIVLIIGESYSKYHSNLYGDRLSTNPRLKARRDRDELDVFTDVVSPYNNTADAIRGMLSFHSNDRSGYWTDWPLFPAVFKAAGYRTSIYDNQMPVRTKDNTLWDLPFTALIFDEEVATQLFSLVNANHHPFDMQLLDDYAEDEHPKGSELCLFHLRGQHVIYKERYPKEFEYFTADSIARPDLNRSQRQIVAEYANATRYNDAVVDAILKLYEDKEAIVIYLSDHGEEIYDYRNFFHRSHQPQITPQIARYQFEVPFMIWMSESYRERHRDIVFRIRKATDRPYISDDLPHLLLDLAGIRVPWYDPSRSVINDRFTPRRRILRTGPYDYDRLMEELLNE